MPSFRPVRGTLINLFLSLSPPLPRLCCEDRAGRATGMGAGRKRDDQQGDRTAGSQQGVGRREQAGITGDPWGRWAEGECSELNEGANPGWEGGGTPI